MQPQSLPALQSGTPTAWEEAVYAFLVEKRARSGSTRTVESYARMLWPFFRVTTPDRVRSADVLAYAHGIGLSGRVPSSATIGARIACLSSFYRFSIRMGLLVGNPCDALARPRTVRSGARATSATLIASMPDSTVSGPTRTRPRTAAAVEWPSGGLKDRPRDRDGANAPGHGPGGVDPLDRKPRAAAGADPTAG